MKVVVTDSLFKSEDTKQGLLVAEVLETGAIQPIKWSEPFAVRVPSGNLWNLCIQGNDYQQCYEVEYNGKDSVFKAPLGEAEEVLFFSKADVTDSSVANLLSRSSEQLLDSTLGEDTSAPAKALDAERTKLRKVVLRIKKRPKRALGQSTVSAKSIKRMPGLAEADVVKAIQALPGVVASSDFSSKIYVRGGGADQNLFLFDQGVVYSPVHFFGLFSTFLVEGIEDVNFYKGGFSPKYGNRLSSVVDISSRKGGEDTLDVDLGGSLKISTFATQAHIEGRAGPFRGLLAGRVTYLKEVIDFLREDAKITDLNLDYRFYDLQGAFFYEPSEDQELSLSFYQGQDKLNFNPFFVDWSNFVIPLNYRLRLNSKWEWKAVAAYSHFDQSFELQNIQSFTNEIDAWTVKPYLEYTYNDNMSTVQGVEYKYIKTRFAQDFEVANFRSDSRPIIHIISPFVEWMWTSNFWGIKLGTRVNYQDPLKSFDWEPRLGIRYNINENRKLDFHVGHYVQYLNSILFGDFETINEFYYPAVKENTQTLKPTSSLLFSLGYTEENLWEEYEFIAETYFKTLNNTVIFDPSAKPDSVRNNPDSELGDFLFAGEGYSYGFELAFNKTKGGIQGGASYAYGHSVLKTLENVMPAKWDIPHSVKLNAQINWKGKAEESIWPHKKKGRYFRSSTQVKYSTGTPYTATEGYYQTNYLGDQQDGLLAGGPNPALEGSLAQQLGCRNCTRYPDYFRWDIKIIDMGRYNKWNFSWTILNITNRVNIFLNGYDTTTNPPTETTINQFPFFPLLLNYEYYF
jgi:hypothetical protein